VTSIVLIDYIVLPVIVPIQPLVDISWLLYEINHHQTDRWQKFNGNDGFVGCWWEL